MTFASGQYLTAAALNAAFTAVTPLTAYKTIETIRDNAGVGTTLTSDPDLQVPVPANSVWRVSLVLSYRADAVPDLKFSWVGPAGATMVNWTARWRTMDGTELSGANTALGSVVTVTAVSGTLHQNINAWGVLVVASTPGTFALQWAQNGASANDTVVEAGSSLILTPIA